MNEHLFSCIRLPWNFHIDILAYWYQKTLQTRLGENCLFVQKLKHFGLQGFLLSVYWNCNRVYSRSSNNGIQQLKTNYKSIIAITYHMIFSKCSKTAIFNKSFFLESSNNGIQQFKTNNKSIIARTYYMIFPKCSKNCNFQYFFWITKIYVK